ncbi:peptidylprolyl isomerase [Hellea balneolensis]|uniref:peptidylprolyl isomerase n=1 Tax=Hellea balneolensis TaxID=287478 RepID=UPI0004249F16|nr:peptidylprolyl isomerase [Hellea balneolensis]
MKNLKLLTAASLFSAMALTGCQDRLVMSDSSPFGEGVVRLGDTEVAEVDGTKIYLSDVERTAASQGLIKEGSPLTPGQPVFQKVLDELIDQRLLALDALRQSLDQDDETRRRLSAARERILGNVLVENHLKNTVNETTIRRMYDEQASLRNRGDEVQARHILLKDEETAQDIAKKLADGADFAALAREMSEDEGSRDKGGNLGYFTTDMFEAVFTNVAFATPKGEVSAPFKTDYGWHILQVQNRRKAPEPSFEEMRSQIVNFMTYDEIQNILKSLRAEGDVKLLFGQAVIGSESVQPETENSE